MASHSHLINTNIVGAAMAPAPSVLIRHEAA
jgi:hypothetical protein